VNSKIMSLKQLILDDRYEEALAMLDASKKNSSAGGKIENPSSLVKKKQHLNLSVNI
jgi:hypothetical protein